MPARTQAKQPESSSETRGVLQYWYSAVKFATRTTFKGKYTTWLRRLLLFILTLVIVRYTMGSVKMTEELNLGIAFGVAAAAFIGLSLLWNLLAAPFRMHKNVFKRYETRINEMEDKYETLLRSERSAREKAEAVAIEAQTTFLEKPSPNLIFNDSSIDTIQLGHGGKTHDVYVVRIPVANDPFKREEEARAHNTHATLEFLTSEDRPIFDPIKGQWSEKPNNFAQSARLMDFLAQGEEHLLDILLKYPEDNYCFAFNYENQQNEGWRSMGREVPSGSKVIVTLKCEGIWDDIVGEFDVLIDENGRPDVRFVRSTVL